MSQTKLGWSPVVFRMGRRLYLRPVEKGDLPLFVHWFNDPEVADRLSMTRPMSLADEERWYADNIAKENSQAVRLVMVLRKGDRPIGSLGLHNINHLHGTATVGWAIGVKGCWGHGYGPEALWLLLDYGFNTLNMRKISAAVYDFNGRSKRGLEKCGFREEARLKAQLFRQGRYVDEIFLATFREDWLLSREKH